MSARILPLVLAAACAGPTLSPELLDAALEVDRSTRIETAVLAPSTATIRVSLPGEVSGRHDALLASPLGGLVEDVRVDEGDAVRKGQVLVEVDEDVYAAQLAQAEAQLRLARDELARTEQLGDLATESELVGRRTQVEVAEAQVRIVRTQVDRATLRAPFDGVVGGVGVDPGEMAAPGAPVVRLVQLDPVKVSLSVSDRDVVALEEGLVARVTTQASSGVREGRIVAIAPVADLQTRSFLVEVEVPNPERTLLPGMIARVEVEREVAAGAIAVPQDWIVTRLDGYGAFVVADGKAVWRSVQLGEIVRGTVMVTAGLAAGDEVVVVGQHGLVDGDPVLVARKGTCCTDGRAVYDDGAAQAQ